ncbi:MULTISPECIES: DUF2231 domain-containing protein [Niastella]|uniref:DUF2231 domain-containing protein n=1 Tax=Niastella soli TaxID=2821487 RepID=A0ABS3YVM5_9BACT|nr:DUF2231 domain-containing protein [Niastella soli]MBO9201582.1 hypothetical protein [Niastella soli]
MDPTHLHLMITHLPIYGSILGTLVLIYGMATKSHHTKMAAYFVLLIASLGGIVAFSTGEAAEETVENMQGISKNLIEEHEEFANITFVVIVVLGVTSLVGLLWKKSKLINLISIIALILSIICVGMSSWTGYLGGQIRHTEIDHVFKQ